MPILPVRVLRIDTPLLIHRLQQIDRSRWWVSDTEYDGGADRIVAAVWDSLAGSPVLGRDWIRLREPDHIEPQIREKPQRFTG